MNKKKIDNIVSTMGAWCASIGLPLCVVGVGIVIFSAVFGREQIIGTMMSLFGVMITSFTLPLIVIKMMVSDVFLGSDE